MKGQARFPTFTKAISDKNLSERATGLAVSIENDACCAALAEVWKGNGVDCKGVAVIVIGTGIGGALIKDGLRFCHCPPLRNVDRPARGSFNRK
ncbi:ROK family protein [Shouchella clausii]|uniref:ROK family protein n=1 Tax=Shouchella clausii TaxID=79880 RepID=A0A268NZX9_SHOCL|nr:ROK family protein [Shouchella clausii]MBU8595602.1 ROK family protein [Shouchella clausii]MDO7288816.1 ROK family protein [Shouchella clausii]MED4160609.1 ROK family protein [Shouchella clausii]PAD10473.1 ROK family protein [Shouchella clausii]PAD44864.1 ROK family protein [Shouchella clausii]